MPATVAVQTVLALGTMLAAEQDARMLLMLGAGLMVIETDPDFVGSWVLVAVTIAVVGELTTKGAEYVPLALMLPTVVFQLTAEE